MRIKGSRPAFPTKGPFEPGLKNSSFAYPGITIRDWFAGQALAGICQSCGFQGGPWETLANHAYQAADAMLAAREEGGDT